MPSTRFSTSLARRFLAITPTEQKQQDKNGGRNQIVEQLTVGPEQTEGTKTTEQTQQQVQSTFQIAFHKANEGIHAKNPKDKDGQYFSPTAANEWSIGK